MRFPIPFTDANMGAWLLTGVTVVTVGVFACDCVARGVGAEFDVGSLLYPLSDAVACIAVLLFVVFLRRHIAAVTHRCDALVGNVAASDYAVLVRGLPPAATVDGVVQHFHRLYSLDADDWTFSGFGGCIGRKTLPRKAVNTKIAFPKVRELSCRACRSRDRGRTAPRTAVLLDRLCRSTMRKRQ